PRVSGRISSVLRPEVAFPFSRATTFAPRLPLSRTFRMTTAPPRASNATSVSGSRPNRWRIPMGIVTWPLDVIFMGRHLEVGTLLWILLLWQTPESWRRLLLRARRLQDVRKLRALEDVREHERRGAALGADVRVRAGLEQRLDAVGRAAALDGPEERGRSVLVRRLHVAAA